VRLAHKYFGFTRNPVSGLARMKNIIFGSGSSGFTMGYRILKYRARMKQEIIFRRPGRIFHVVDLDVITNLKEAFYKNEAVYKNRLACIILA
jgi:hypothetical protein